jgi:hypothetical protein
MAKAETAIRNRADVVLSIDMVNGGDPKAFKDDGLLEKKAYEALETGRVPRCLPDQVLGGVATGANCAVCEMATVRETVELELTFDDAELARYHAHPRCFFVLRRAITRLLRANHDAGTA